MTQNPKKQILNRIYIIYIFLLLTGGLVIWKIIQIQFVEGKKWRSLANSLHHSKKKITSDRGTIYSADNNILSISLPYYDLYADFSVAYLHTDGGYHFKQNIDSLAYNFAAFFEDKSTLEYKEDLEKIYKNQKVIRFKKNIDYEQKKSIQNFPLIRQGRYKSGISFVEKNKRIYPYGLLAKRTLGVVRDTMIHNVGLESTYDYVLRGSSGYQMIRYIAGGVYAPMEDYQVEPAGGKDIVTTIDTRIQDITENALLKMLKKNEAEWGCALVMEVATGKIKAIANLSIDSIQQSYYERVNYALLTLEPGSTFKMITLLALLEDKRIRLDDEINVFGGTYEYAKDAVMKDSEKPLQQKMTVRESFARSSNVGISQLAYQHYRNNPDKFLHYFKKLHISEPSGIDLLGERTSYYKTPQHKQWNKITTLPWMSIGYEIALTPIKLLTIYNAVANKGTMMRPYLVSDIYDQGRLVQHIQPQIIEKQICSKQTLEQLYDLLLSVSQKGSTRSLFAGAAYEVGGKTGTSRFYGSKGYKDSIHQASFAGFFPLKQPLYTCVVFIKNKPKAKVYYGAKVAAPVFKEIADKLYALHHVSRQLKEAAKRKKTPPPLPFNQNDFTLLSKNKDKSKALIMPNLNGKSVDEIVEVMEKLALNIKMSGRGAIIRKQNIPPGTLITHYTNIKVETE